MFSRCSSESSPSVSLSCDPLRWTSIRHFHPLPSHDLIRHFSSLRGLLPPSPCGSTTLAPAKVYLEILSLMELLAFLLPRQPSMVLSLTSFYFQQSEVLKSFHKFIKIKPDLKIFFLLKQKKGGEGLSRTGCLDRVSWRNQKKFGERQGWMF